MRCGLRFNKWWANPHHLEKHVLHKWGLNWHEFGVSRGGLPTTIAIWVGSRLNYRSQQSQVGLAEWRLEIEYKRSAASCKLGRHNYFERWGSELNGVEYYPNYANL